MKMISVAYILGGGLAKLNTLIHSVGMENSLLCISYDQHEVTSVKVTSYMQCSLGDYQDNPTILNN